MVIFTINKKNSLRNLYGRDMLMCGSELTGMIQLTFRSGLIPVSFVKVRRKYILV